MNWNSIKAIFPRLRYQHFYSKPLTEIKKNEHKYSHIFKNKWVYFGNVIRKKIKMKRQNVLSVESIVISSIWSIQKELHNYGQCPFIHIGRRHVPGTHFNPSMQR